jgi:hypothetical protein
MMKLLACAVLLAMLLYPDLGAAQNVGFTQADRDMLVELSVRVDEMDKRFDQLISFLWMIVGIFTTIAAVTISLTIWDRTTSIRPFTSKISTVEQNISENSALLQRLLESLRNLARDDPKVARVLRQFHLL